MFQYPYPNIRNKHNVDLPAAFAVAVAPFLIPDAVKLVAAVVCAHAVKRALPRR